MPRSSITEDMKAAFAHRLREAFLGMGINQSELARRADLPRDAISTYMRGRSFPTNENLAKLAKALGMNPAELAGLPEKSPKDEAGPAFAMKVSAMDPGKAWISVESLVSFAAAAEIAKIISAETAAVDIFS